MYVYAIHAHIVKSLLFNIILLLQYQVCSSHLKRASEENKTLKQRCKEAEKGTKVMQQNVNEANARLMQVEDKVCGDV